MSFLSRKPKTDETPLPAEYAFRMVRSTEPGGGWRVLTLGIATDGRVVSRSLGESNLYNIVLCELEQKATEGDRNA